MAPLADSLKSRGLLDRTILIVTADHGELFREHDEFTHGQGLYTQALHVPLFIRAPGLAPAGRRIGDFVTLRDIAATISRADQEERRAAGSFADTVLGSHGSYLRPSRESGDLVDLQPALVGHFAAGRLPRTSQRR